MKQSLIVFFFAISTPCLAQRNYADSLMGIINTSPNDTLKITAYSFLIDHFTETQPDTAFKFSGQMLALSRKLNLKIMEADALSNMGYAQVNLGNYPGSLESLLSAIKIAEDPSSEKPHVPAKYFHDNEFLVKPVTMRMRRLSVLAQTHQYLGILYNNTNNIEKEMTQYRYALNYAKESGNVVALVTTHLTMGRVYMMLKKTDSALYAEQRGYHLADSTGFKKYNGSFLITLGRIEASMGNDEKAMHYFRQAIRESGEQDYLRGVISSNLYIADIFKKSGLYDSMFYYQRAALKVAETLNSASLLLRSYNALAGYYTITGNKDSLVKYQALVIKLNDSLFNAKQFQQFENIDADAEQRRLEMVAAKKAYEQRLQNYLLLGGLIAFLVVAIILYRNIQHRKKVHYKLEKQKTELENTLRELRVTQAQLIQSEKMASLGEMTAGIAHEIQNPLNFVNNFSEINKDLLGEMKEELLKNNLTEAINLAANVTDNEEKIIYHGKRADAIVKSMLQHSRASSGTKEETDINKLCDEYLRLAFHGLRAKDKSFNAKFETDLDPTIGMVNVVSQDIGRVLLNLINNAFYAVSEKARTSPGADYQPLIKVITRRHDKTIEIIIQDNGIGITEKNRDKIFQPFFTTKAPGQGTGLGLSLSYDIITKGHGGELKVKSNEGGGSEFTIELPLS